LARTVSVLLGASVECVSSFVENSEFTTVVRRTYIVQDGANGG
jgi:hypothetical protein